jgi:hypothetical protein
VERGPSFDAATLGVVISPEHATHERFTRGTCPHAEGFGRGGTSTQMRCFGHSGDRQLGKGKRAAVSELDTR